MNPTLTLGQIKLNKEDTYFAIVAVFAILCWFAVALTIIGLIYGLLIAFFIWLANGLVIAHLKAESVLVTEQQMPALHRAYMAVVALLELKETPPLYITQANGLLNAFATRWSGRHFVVVYSDMLEACGEDTAQIRFLLGHELGHVRSNHVLKKVLLLPGLLMPLVGSAYSRACEGTCDRYGAYAAGDLRAAAQAVLILAGGKNAWRDMDPEAFSRQYQQERGFFISWHELTSGYPTLSQRTYNLLTMDSVAQPVGAPRHPLAYVFAFFSAGGRQGTGGNLLVTVAVIAILAGIALPAFTEARKRAEQVREMQQMPTAAPATGNTGSAVMKTMTFSSDVDAEGKASDNLNQLPSTQQTFYAIVVWQLTPGSHNAQIELADGSGKTLKVTKYTFTAQQSDWRSWFKISLDGIPAKPSEFQVTIYLDGQQMGVEKLPVSGSL